MHKLNRYEGIIKSSSIGYAYHRIVVDNHDRPVDYEFIEVNSAFETITGLSSSDIIGRKVSLILPGIMVEDFDWIGYFGDVALHGGSKEFEQWSQPLSKWFRVCVSSEEKFYFSTLFIDISSNLHNSQDKIYHYNGNFDVFNNIDMKTDVNSEQYNAGLIKPVKNRDLYSYLKNLAGGISPQTSQMKSNKPSFSSEQNFSEPFLSTDSKSGSRLPAILIAEDNNINMVLITTIIKSINKDIEIVEVRTGRNAVDRFKEKEFDLIFMDIQMPDLDGITATRMIREVERERRKRVPIIALTAGVLKEDRENAIRSGMDRFLTKPIEENKIAAIIDEYIFHRTHESHIEVTPFDDLIHFDADKLNNRFKGNKEAFKRIVDAAIEQYPLYIESLQRAAENGDIEEIARVAHSIRGSSYSMCFDRIASIAGEIEKKADDLPSAKELIPIVKNEWDIIKDLL